MSLKNQLNPHLCSLLDYSQASEQYQLNWRDVLSSRRLDVVAKYLFARDRELGQESCWAEEFYKEHIDILNGFKERDGSGKSCFEDFRDSFVETLESVKEHGFLADESLLPLDCHGSIIDGAHRLAACIAYDQNVSVVKFPVESKSYDAEALVNMGFPDSMIERLVLEYARLSKKIKVCVLFPVADSFSKAIETSITDIGILVFKKRLNLSQRGMENIIRVLYRGEPWVQSSDSHSGGGGVEYHIKNRFTGETPVTFFIFESSDEQPLVSAKAKMRELCNKGNWSLHINDHHCQTMDILDLILDPQGVRWINHAKPCYFNNFELLFSAYLSLLKKKKVDVNRYCLDGSAPLAAFGLRDVVDLDYLVHGDDALADEHSLISEHNSESAYHAVDKDRIIFHPENHFRLFGVKFTALNRILEMKANRGEPKDDNDISLIRGLDAKYKPSARDLLSLCVTKYRYYRYRLKSILGGRLSGWPKELVKSLYLLPFDLIDRLSFFGARSNYRGFKVYHSVGDSLIRRIRIQQTYEPEVTLALIRYLRELESPVFVDIGANIGLISLNVLASIPRARIFAFEPGKTQFEHLSRTIKSNGLEGRLTGYNVGLSRENGWETFYIHGAKDSSGDGFNDTGRAGDAQQIQVQVTKLDTWWENQGEPEINVLKVDTEGAEMMVFEGCTRILSELKPVILFEVHPANLASYPYQADDVIGYLTGFGYQVSTLSGKLVSDVNLSSVLTLNNDLIAVPSD